MRQVNRNSRRRLRRPRLALAGRQVRNLISLALWPLVIITTVVSVEWIWDVHNAGRPDRNVQWWCGGFMVWTLLYLIAPAPTRAYVLGHELSHVLWTWLLGGHARRLRVHNTGGSVEVSIQSPWITLAPYLLPFYPIVVLLLFAAVEAFTNTAPYRPLWYGVLGASWAFHVTFTLSMMRRGQPDLEEVGWWFSIAVILGVNLLLFDWILGWVAGASFQAWWLLWWNHVHNLMTAVSSWIRRVTQML